MRDTYTFEKKLRGPDQEWHLSLELTDEEYAALGRVSAQWAFLEHLIHWISERMLNALGETHRAMNSDSFRQRNRLFRELSDRLFSGDPNRDRLMGLIDEAGSLQGERQRLIHGLLDWDHANPEALLVSTRKNANGRPWRIAVADINRVADKIAVLNAKLHSFPETDAFATISSGLSREYVRQAKKRPTDGEP
jgi:hypothetical protein